MEFDKLTDEQLLELAKTNADALDFLLIKYKILVKKLCRTYFLIGAEPEDLIQEGMIGLYKASQSYVGSNVPFNYFAKICITRQIKTALKSANRQKNKPLNDCISITPFDIDSNDETFFGSTNKTPEDKFMEKENINDIKHFINSDLSKMEKEILELYLCGLSHSEIAKQLNITSKSIENSLSRTRTKFKQYYNKLK